MRIFLTLFLLTFSIAQCAERKTEAPKVVEQGIKEGPQVLILFGPPGAGKGTQAALLKDKLQVPHISTGDLLREHLHKESNFGKQAKGFMDKGQLVPDQLILQMLFERIDQKDCARGYILDGFPRTLGQAEALNAHFTKGERIFAVHLDLADQKIVDRLSKRLTCEKCQAPFHQVTAQPKQQGKCDHCAGNLIQRSDDNAEVIGKRLKVYHEQTSPLINFYKQKKVLKSVSCDAPKEQIFKEIASELK